MRRRARCQRGRHEAAAVDGVLESRPRQRVRLEGGQVHALRSVVGAAALDGGVDQAVYLFGSADASFDLRHTHCDATRILYLHGGLHLVRNLDGTARLAERKDLSAQTTTKFEYDKNGIINLCWLFRVVGRGVGLLR